MTMNEAAGTWRSDEPGQPFLKLNAEGAAWGTDGCNGINTTYTLAGSTITLDPWFSTMRACMGVNTWLQNAHSCRIEGDSMRVCDRTGAEIGTLVRSAEDVTDH